MFFPLVFGEICERKTLLAGKEVSCRVQKILHLFPNTNQYDSEKRNINIGKPTDSGSYKFTELKTYRPA